MSSDQAASDAILPPLRALDIVPVSQEGELLFVLRDPTQLSPRTMAVSPVGYFVLAHLDGRHTRGQIAERFQKQYEAELPLEQIDVLVAALEEALLLETPQYAHTLQQRMTEYAESAARDNRGKWPAAAALREEIERMLRGGDPGAAATGPVAGVIAPHLDYARGGPCYADAYRALGRAAHEAERFVILGTNHYGRARSVVATTRDFLTPLGQVETDRAFLSQLETRLGHSLCAEQFDHLHEHSVELQVHILQVLRGDRPFTIVPVLCPDPCGPTGTRPPDGRGPDLAEFAGALGELIAADPRPTLLIASADLSHVGQRFGETAPATSEFLEQVATSDRGLLALMESRRDADFVARVREAGNPTRICSVGCIYALLQALPGRPARLLRYHQATDFENDTHVTCCAAFLQHI